MDSPAEIRRTDGGRLRLEDEGMGPPLSENQTLDTVGVVQGHRIILEPGPAPSEEQLVLRCTLSSGSKEWEVIVDRGTTVADCCDLMICTAGLSGNQWHLRRTNWCGEAADLLEDETEVLHKENLKSGELLLIEEGRLPPKNFVRLTLSLFTPSYPSCPPTYLSNPSLAAGFFSWVVDSATVIDGSNEEGLTLDGELTRFDSSEVPLHLQSPAQFYPGLPGCLMGLDSIEIHRDSTIEDLKAIILTLPALIQADLPTLAFLRLREVVDGRLGKVFKNPQLTLRRGKLVTGSHIAVSVLDYEENLPTNAIVFTIQARTPDSRRSYGPPAEVIYDTTNSTKPSELIKFLSSLVQVDTDHLRVAKHKIETFEWISLQDNYHTEGGGGGGGKKKKGRGSSRGSVNLKNSPISLRDGDRLGLKCLHGNLEDRDDFTTPADDHGREILAAVHEEKRRKRKQKSTDLLGDGGVANQRPRRTEVGIKIFVPDYKRTT